MQLLQLITIVGLCLSYGGSAAAALVTTLTGSPLIKQVVELMTRPDVAVRAIPELKPFEGMVAQSPRIFDRQFHNAAWETVNTLHEEGQPKHSSYIFQSVQGYHSTTDADRQQIYRNSIYSRIVDLAKEDPQGAMKHLQHMAKNLELRLELAINNEKLHELPPLGDEAVIAEAQKLLALFEKEHHQELHQFSEKMIASLPSSHNVKNMDYLSIAEVNRQLKETEKKEGAGKAMLIDGFAAFKAQLLKAQKAHSSHHTTPVAAPPAAKPISVGA